MPARKILAERARHMFVAPSTKPLRQHLDEWLAGSHFSNDSKIGN